MFVCTLLNCWTQQNCQGTVIRQTDRRRQVTVDWMCFVLKISQLCTLIGLLIGELTKGDRQKIMTICTIDVHSRDMVSKMIQQKVESSAGFQWQSQLRHRYPSVSRPASPSVSNLSHRFTVDLVPFAQCVQIAFLHRWSYFYSSTTFMQKVGGSFLILDVFEYL